MVADRFLEVGGLDLHYRDWGGEGRPLVLLHGLASTCHIFDRVAPLLAEGLHVLALDQRGHGESAKPEQGYGFDEVTADLAAFLDALKLERPIIAGHSWGGNVALQFAADFPERPAALVLIDGGFLDIQANPEMSWERTRELMAPPRLAGMPLAEFKERIQGWVGPMRSPLAEDAVLANMEILPDGTIRPRLSFERHMLILRALWEQRPPQLYPLVRCPVLMIPAAMPHRDDAEKAMLDRKRMNVEIAQDLLAQSETVWFDETVHDIPLQRPERLAQVILDFARKIG